MLHLTKCKYSVGMLTGRRTGARWMTRTGAASARQTSFAGLGLGAFSATRASSEVLRSPYKVLPFYLTRRSSNVSPRRASRLPQT